MMWHLAVCVLLVPVFGGVLGWGNWINSQGSNWARMVAAIKGAVIGVVIGFIASLVVVIAGNAFANGNLWKLISIGGFGIGICLMLSSRSGNTERILRWAGISNTTSQQANKNGSKSVYVGAIRLPEAVLPLSFLAAGSPGSGKSQALNRVLTSIRARGEVAVIADAGGEALARWYREGDYIFNPLDTRSVRWSPFSEMAGPWDAARLATSIVPSMEGPDGEWYKMSQDLVQAVLTRLWESGRTTNKDLIYYLTVAKAEEVETLVAGLPAQALFDAGAGKMLASVRGIVGTQLSAFSYLDQTAGKDDFSIRRWFLESRTTGTWLWMPYRADMVDLLKSLIAVAVDVVACTALSERPNLAAKMVYLVMDELPAVGKIESLQTVLAQGRKYRMAAFCGFQSVSQLEKVYGKQGMQALMACFQNRLILRTVDPETAEYLSKMVGDHEIERETESTSTTTGGEHSTKSTSTRRERKVQRAILPAQIQSLPSRVGFLALAEAQDIYQVSIPIVEREEVASPFELRSFEVTSAPAARSVFKAAAPVLRRATNDTAPAQAIKIEIE